MIIPRIGAWLKFLENQKDEANANFTKFVLENYKDWLNDPAAPRPLLSHQLMKKRVFPELQPGQPLFFYSN